MKHGREGGGEETSRKRWVDDLIPWIEFCEEFFAAVTLLEAHIAHVCTWRLWLVTVLNSSALKQLGMLAISKLVHLTLFHLDLKLPVSLK